MSEVREEASGEAKPVFVPNPGPQTNAFLCDATEVLYAGGRGCVHPDTMLDTPNGPCAIKDWRGGEVYTMRDGEVAITYATPPVVGSAEDMYEVTLDCGASVVVTDEHRFLTPFGWAMLKDLDVGSEVISAGHGAELTGGDRPHAGFIASIRHVNHQRYMDIHVPETECYFAHGILHHNSGKSALLYGKVLRHIAQYRGRAKMIFFRENVDDLGDLIEKGKDFLVRPGFADYVAGNTRLFRFKDAFDGATLKMRHLERPDDLKAYKGHEYTLVGIDEVVDFRVPFLDIRDAFLACLRNPHGIHGQIVYTGNPGGYNHASVKAHFIDPWPQGNRIIKNEFGQTRCYFFSTVKDNPYLANDPSYMAQLKSLRDPVLRRAWLRGDWNVAVGAMFSDVWSPSKHILPFSISGNDIPKHWPRFRALDWGSSSPFCCMWYTIATGEELRSASINRALQTPIPAGALVFYREYYGWRPGLKRNEGLRMGSNEVAAEISRLEREGNEHGLVRPGPADTQIFAVLDGTPIYDSFYRQGVHFVAANKSSGSIAAGIEMIRTRLIGEDGRPQIYFTRDCVNTIRTLPELARDRNNWDVPASGQEDHCFPGETLVLTARGRVPIKDIVAGDEVMTRAGWRKVLASGKTAVVDELVRVEVDDDGAVESTGSHPFFANGEWKEATRLEVGDRMTTPMPIAAAVSDVADILCAPTEVYNLTVESEPEFFVYAGDTPILVHNCADVLRYACLALTQRPSTMEQQVSERTSRDAFLAELCEE